MRQHGKGKGKALEPPECSQCMERGLECELGPSKSTSCTECREAKAKCKWPGKEKPERKCKQAQMEELETGPSGLKRLKKMLEERSDEMAEVLGAGLKAIMDTLSKQGRLL